MRSFARRCVDWGYERYDRAWQRTYEAGLAHGALDGRAFGWRYLSLGALVLRPDEEAHLARLTTRFGRLLTWATHQILEDPAWWSGLSWPWAAVELARQEPVWVPGEVTAYGRFDWLKDARDDSWQLVEYNADTPSGGREVSGYDAPVARLHRGERSGGAALSRTSVGLEGALARALVRRVRGYERTTGTAVQRIGVVSSHGWVEDMAQAWWLAGLLGRAGVQTLVGDVRDLAVVDGQPLLRAKPIQALYRFYPVERLYQHGVFAPLWDAGLDRRLLLLNGLRGFLAQSKLVLAYLWQHRDSPRLDGEDRALIERHLPAIAPARSAEGQALRTVGVVKHVNGREGNEVAYGADLDDAAWEARLLDGGYVVQRRVEQVPVEAVEVNEADRSLGLGFPRYACVGAFCVGGRYGGLYTRVGGPITLSRAQFVPTLVQRAWDAAEPRPRGA